MDKSFEKALYTFLAFKQNNQDIIYLLVKSELSFLK